MNIRATSLVWIALLGIGLPVSTGAADHASASARVAARAGPPRCSGTAVSGSATSQETEGPEIATGFASKDVTHTRTLMAVTANPVASRAACDILVAGGSAVDAAVAAQMVLNLVEPQSSGIGGGAFMLVYDARAKTLQSYDGRETAPAAATGDYLRYIDASDDRSTPRPSIRASGRSIGTPGVLRMLELAHRDHGRLPWKRLFEPGIALATRGFRISPRMAASIEAERIGLARDADAAAYFLDGHGHGKPAGTWLKNPLLAQTFTTIAARGAAAFYNGELAEAIVAKITEPSSLVTPGRTTLADLAGYEAKRREPVCSTYRIYRVCSMGPPSSGGIAVEATLGILEPFDLAAYAPNPIDRDGGKPAVEGVHLIAEAERLAYADRDKYVADTDFVPLPGGSPAALLDPTYLRSRAALIDPTRSMGRASPGDFGPVPLGVADTREHGTTQLTIADAQGNVVTMTTTVESGFGSFHFVRGFVLNNQLTDFSINPTDANGTPIANRVAGGKRPRSAMAPTMVFAKNADDASHDQRGDFVLATGSAGGFVIIQYVVKTLVGALDWGLDAQQAVSLIDFGAANSPTTYVGGEHPDVDARDGGAHDALVTGLRAMGHNVSVVPHSSGITMLRRVTIDGRPAWSGGADPRREGAAIGDAVRR
jgi:gamma-glutamyltranspeptidase/glutathione hydrolase